jgi:hypothetical protein
VGALIARVSVIAAVGAAFGVFAVFGDVSVPVTCCTQGWMFSVWCGVVVVICFWCFGCVCDLFVWV